MRAARPPRRVDAAIGRDCQPSDRSLLFYNNLELMHVPFFRSPQVARFTEFVLGTLGVWRFRWGDALVRFAQVGLFRSRIHCLSVDEIAKLKEDGTV